MKSLFYTGESIKCRGCEQEFEVARNADPEKLVMALERVAARHQCRGPVKPGRQAVRVYQMPTGAGLNLYYAREMQRHSA